MPKFLFLSVIGLMTDSHTMRPTNYRNAFRFLTVAGVAISISIFAFNTAASAQSPSTGLLIDDVTITIVAKPETPNGVAHRASVTVRNSSETNFSGLQRLDYTVDGGERQLAYIVTQLGSGESLTITFELALIPGERTINVTLGDSEVSRTLTVTGADIGIAIVEHRLKRGKTVEFVMAITNSGERTARDLTLSSAWQETSSDDISERNYDGPLQDLATAQRTTVIMPFQINPGSYQFSFEVTSSSLETDHDNNSATVMVDIDYVDLQVQLLSAKNVGWDSDGNGLMSLNVKVENAGVEDMNSFYVGVDCRGEWMSNCSSSTQFSQLLAGVQTTSEFRLWLPVGDTPISIFAVENEDTYRWGESNVVETTITTPQVPEQVWTLSRTSEPNIASYWSDGSANVELDLTFVNNGTDESSTINIQCTQDESTIEGCGGEVSLDLVDNVYPTVVHQSLRLPSGNTTLQFHYGTDEPTTLLASVPERIVGVERDVWDCFTDTSNLDPQTGEQAAGGDEGIGCAGWVSEDVTKWPLGEPIKLWSHGHSDYLEILDDVLDDTAPFLNLEFERVATREEAQLKVHTGVAREDAELTGLDCIDFAGCAETSVDDDGQITASTIAIWLIDQEDERWRSHFIRVATLHELLHALTNIQHRHHDRTSVMSYDALNYTTIEGMDRGLFELLAHPLVEPGMSFDDVHELIVFADELNDPPEPEELSAHTLLRRAHAALMDAGAMSFEVRGGWPGCTGLTFGPAELEFGNLLPHHARWHHFHDGNYRYYYVGHHTDWSESEWWSRRGRQWSDVGVDSVFDGTSFASWFSLVPDMLSEISIYANASDYSVVYRTDKRVEIAARLDEPNPTWSRGLERKIRIVLDAKSFVILEYEMTWNFDLADRDSCDSYQVKARNPKYGIEFNFPDAILEASALLSTEVEADDEVIEESTAR